jgi:hypothetical protein
MSQPSENNSSLLISYLALRKAVGVIGIALPVVLVLGNWQLFHSQAFEDSISYYYYTGMRGVLVGSLWAIGIFLMSYRGYQRRDEIAGRLACVFALGVALFPTARETGTCDIGHLFRLDHGGCDAAHIISFFHATCAALLFTTLAYFSLFLFTETHPGREQDMTRRKRERNVVYYVCGWIIVASIISILTLHEGLHISQFGRLPVLFSLESVAVIAFGASWLVKGEFILKDQ